MTEMGLNGSRRVFSISPFEEFGSEIQVLAFLAREEKRTGL